MKSLSSTFPNQIIEISSTPYEEYRAGFFNILHKEAIKDDVRIIFEDLFPKIKNDYFELNQMLSLIDSWKTLFKFLSLNNNIQFILLLSNRKAHDENFNTIYTKIIIYFFLDKKLKEIEQNPETLIDNYKELAAFIAENKESIPSEIVEYTRSIRAMIREKLDKRGYWDNLPFYSKNN